MAIVFLTGGTGFVGAATLVRLLAEPRVEEIHVLVRAHDLSHARERMAQSLARFDIAMPKSGRVGFVIGSLSAFRLPSGLRERATHVVHAAAHTSFRSVRTARVTNVEGTRSLSQAFCGAPRLERFLFVGTAYRLGVAKVGVVEEDMPSSSEHLVEYTRTKAEAEVVLESLEELPLVTARPSIVVGHTRLGVKPSASLFWYYRALAKAGVSPFADERRRDIVPVDWVADALTLLLLKPTLAHRRYHVSAGEGSAEAWAGIHSEFAHWGDAPPASEYVSPVGMAEHPAWRAAGFSKYSARAVETCAQFSKLTYDVFSNERLLAEGIATPPALHPLSPALFGEQRSDRR